ncbi:DUF3311 domain-containing protein [Bacillus sp. DTU_2020_1000418_1_SI_GHA_SEK_038]|uniref:DUF3311 domain-containing protein n=1 Tax=Bacillus sp. DTU_2020_1000418_1_SI_GHA_SEK_038 TaxID=3077585 RepID=UPI0028E85DE6|nr:DUF3311 domain-containing protein [Bacillus sp. DTU_2020_1000418_1_SI_GHA_SEK_038]WNS74999.1 DUF3311 domain-containing protein [Bacillus sp. DTU_2020_1000418_1_SI_GHA_SEK_038]
MSKRTFNTLYIAIGIIPFLMLVFPGFELGNRATPIIMGLPFSFFWVLLWIVITFVALIILYRLDPEKDEEEDV